MGHEFAQIWKLALARVESLAYGSYPETNWLAYLDNMSSTALTRHLESSIWLPYWSRRDGDVPRSIVGCENQRKARASQPRQRISPFFHKNLAEPYPPEQGDRVPLPARRADLVKRSKISL